MTTLQINWTRSETIIQGYASQMLGKGIGIAQTSGSPRTDGETIWLPAMPKHMTIDSLRYYRGLIDHEQAHIMFNSFDVQPADLSRVEHNLFNAIEDGRIESCMKNRYPGSIDGIDYMNDKILSDWSVDSKELGRQVFSACCLTAIGRHDKAEELTECGLKFLNDNGFIPRIAEVTTPQSTPHDVLALVREILEAIQPEEPDKPEAGGSEGDSGDSGDSGDGDSEEKRLRRERRRRRSKQREKSVSRVRAGIEAGEYERDQTKDRTTRAIRRENARVRGNEGWPDANAEVYVPSCEVAGCTEARESNAWSETGEERRLHSLSIAGRITRPLQILFNHFDRVDYSDPRTSGQRINRKRLAHFAAGSDIRVLNRRSITRAENTSVLIACDNSGSMKGSPALWQADNVTAISIALDRARIRSAVLYWDDCSNMLTRPFGAPVTASTPVGNGWGGTCPAANLFPLTPILFSNEKRSSRKILLITSDGGWCDPELCLQQLKSLVRDGVEPMMFFMANPEEYENWDEEDRNPDGFARRYCDKLIVEWFKERGAWFPSEIGKREDLANRMLESLGLK